jgi:hypothetical protein
MGRRCTICSSPNRADIDLAIAAGTGFRGIARSFRGVTADSVGRHAVSHLPIAVIVAAEIVETERAIDCGTLTRQPPRGGHNEGEQ